MDNNTTNMYYILRSLHYCQTGMCGIIVTDLLGHIWLEWVGSVILGYTHAMHHRERKQIIQHI